MGNKKASLKLVLIVCAVIALLAAGAVFWKVKYSDSYKNKASDTSSYDAETYQSYGREPANAEPVSYEGVDGKSALALLDEKAEITTEQRYYGAYVDSINGVKATGDHYWALYVNGELAQQSADEYITKTGDKIEWKLE